MTTDTQPARRNRKAVVFCVDAAYFPFALFLADQLHRHDPGRDYDFCLASDMELRIPPGLEHLQIRMLPPLDDSDYAGLTVTHLARSTYLRLWVPQQVGADYDRVLYLDSDIFADAGGLSRLMDIDMRGKAIAAVLDVQQWYRTRRDVTEFRQAGRPGRKYFNGGILLIDTAAYARDRVLERSIEIAQAHPEWIRHHDQSLLNLVMDGDWVELSPVWNWQWAWKYPLYTDWVGPRLLHFIGPNKPWHDPQGFCPVRCRIACAGFLAQFFPEVTVTEPHISPLRNTRRLWWLLVRFVVQRRSLLRLLDRFPDPYTTR